MLSKNLKDRRLKKKMTHLELSKKSGLSIKQISRYENDVCTNISTDSLSKLAKALKCKPSLFLKGIF